MQVNVRFLDNLRLEASFDDYKIVADQPIRYKGDGTAPGPFDYFLASSALCAAYFVKVYCIARNIPTEDIKVSQNNIIDPENRYNQIFNIEIELPESISEKDRAGIIAAMERCTVKRVIQNNPGFKIHPKNVLGTDNGLMFENLQKETKTFIPGKDASLEESIQKLSGLLEKLGIKIEVASWRNPVPHVWSVHIRDADSPLCFTNGKGATKDAALASALGEYLERTSTNYFYSDYYLGEDISKAEFVHYPNEKWFIPGLSDSLPSELMDEHFLSVYNEDGELRASHLIDTNSGNKERGICAVPYIRQSDQKTIYVPVNLIANMFVSNGMSAGNSKYEARVQALSEIFERAVKSEIIKEEITLPDVPKNVLEKFPRILEGIKDLEDKGYPIYVKDASLGGRFPVVSVTLMNPRTGGVFASFGAHPHFEVALERTLTELMQGRSFEGLNDMLPPTFNSYAVREHNNLVDHFIDSSGVVSWKFFSEKPDYEFKQWDFSGTTEEQYHYLMNIFKELEKEVYIADYNELGAHTCRILVPGYSEIYEPSDLVWDNHNKSLRYRQAILNLHRLSDKELKKLLRSFEEIELDDYMLISELIGVAFEETSTWGQLTLLELKIQIYLALGKKQEAQELVEMFTTYNDNLAGRKKYYKLVSILLDIELDPTLEYAQYEKSLARMYGEELLEIAANSVSGTLRFYDIPETDMNLKGIEKHIKLVESYQKLQVAKKAFHQGL